MMMGGTASQDGNLAQLSKKELNLYCLTISMRTVIFQYYV